MLVQTAYIVFIHTELLADALHTAALFMDHCSDHPSSLGPRTGLDEDGYRNGAHQVLFCQTFNARGFICYHTQFRFM